MPDFETTRTSELAGRWRDTGFHVEHDELAARWLPGDPVSVFLGGRWLRGDYPVSCRRCATSQAIELHMTRLTEADRATDVAKRNAEAATRDRVAGRVSIPERARRLADRHVQAIAGSGGAATLMRLAAALARGFALDVETAMPIALEWDARNDPPWGKREIRRALDNARRRGKLPMGFLLTERRRK